MLKAQLLQDASAALGDDSLLGSTPGVNIVSIFENFAGRGWYNFRRIELRLPYVGCIG